MFLQPAPIALAAERYQVSSVARLSVTAVNPDAVRFYEACGYTRTGITTPLARHASVGEIELAKDCGAKINPVRG